MAKYIKVECCEDCPHMSGSASWCDKLTECISEFLKGIHKDCPLPDVQEERDFLFAHCDTCENQECGGVSCNHKEE